MPEIIEYSLYKLEERILKLKKGIENKELFNIPKKIIEFNLPENLDREDLKEFFRKVELERRYTTARRQEFVFLIHRIDMFQNAIKDRDFGKLLFRPILSGRCNLMEMASRIEELNNTQLNELLNRLSIIRHISLGLDIAGIQHEFIPRFLAYQAREEETIQRIQEIDNEISKEGTTKEKENKKKVFENHLKETLIIQRMILRGIVLAQYALKVKEGDENQIRAIWNGLVEIIEKLGNAIEEEKDIYQRITSSNYVSAVDVENSLNQIMKFFSHINTEEFFTRNQIQTIIPMNPIHAMYIYYTPKLNFNSIEVINTELSRFVSYLKR